MVAIQQTVDIPAEREISLKLPETVPVGRATITVSVGETGKDTESVLQSASAKVEVISADSLKKLIAGNLRAMQDKAVSQPLDYRDAQIAIAFTSGKTHKDKSYIKYAGCLKNSPLFKGDSVAIQKAMRSEWD